MNYTDWAKQVERMPYRVQRALESVAEEMYEYAVENDDLPEEVVAMLNGVAKACEVI